MLAIPSTENPEPLAMLVLDPEIISNGVAFGGSTPPFPTDTLRPIGADDRMGDAAPFESLGRVIGQPCQHIFDAFRPPQHPGRSRPQRGPAIGYLQREDPPDATLRNIALTCRWSINRGLPQARDDLIDQRSEVCRRILTKIGCQRNRIERLGSQGNEPHAVDAEARVDRLDLHRQKAEHMGNVTRTSRRSDNHCLFRAIDPLTDETQNPDTEPSRQQESCKVLRQIGDDTGDRLGCADWLSKAPYNVRHLERDDRNERLCKPSGCLVQPAEQATTQAPAQRRTRHRDQIADPFDAQPLRAIPLTLVESEGRYL